MYFPSIFTSWVCGVTALYQWPCTSNQDPTGFSAVFSSDMVLQRSLVGQRATLFGPLDTEETFVTVTMLNEMDGKPVFAKNASLGEHERAWKVVMDPMEQAGGSYTVQLFSSKTGKVVSELNRVTFGDVFVCAGQSNMALMLPYTFSYPKLLKKLGENKEEWDRRLRYFHFAGMDDLNAGKENPTFVVTSNGRFWSNMSHALETGSIKDFSSTCMYFGNRLVKRLDETGLGKDVPIGLIHGAVGGTMIEAWIDNSTTNTCNNTAIDVKGRVPAASLYNGVVAPLVNMTITGWVWYQGENNMNSDPGFVGSNDGYGCTLPALIKKWRSMWSLEPQTTLPKESPFVVVTLAAGGDEGKPQHMAQMRLSQMETTKLSPYNMHVHAYDLGDPWFLYGECTHAGCCPKSIDPSGTSKFIPGPQCLGRQKWWYNALDDGRADIDGDWYNNVVGYYMGPIHSRAKRRLGDRLAVASLYYYESHNNNNNNHGKFQSNMNPSLRKCDANATSKTIDLTFDTVDPLVSLSKSDRIVPNQALQVCVGDKAQCSCPFWDYERTNTSGTRWFCTFNKGFQKREYDDDVNWRPQPNPAEKLWQTIDGVQVVGPNVLRIKIPSSLDQIVSMRYAFSSFPCANLNDSNLRNGTYPIPLRNCGLFTKNYQMPFDPFFVMLDQNNGMCRSRV